MKKRLLYCLMCVAMTWGVSSCEKLFMDSDPDDFSYEDMFESLWKTVDEKYSYLSYKNIDWKGVYDEKKPLVNPSMTTLEFYKVLCDMLYVLEDGHVNLYAGFDYARNWQWYLDAPQNFVYSVIERNYLGADYWASGGLKNTILDDGKYGYIYYGSFSSSITYMPIILDRFKDTRGIIIDVRDNGGGSLDNAEALADYIADTRRHTYSIYYKAGAGHDDFSEPYHHYSTPRGNGYERPIIILTNRSCYSATSHFVTMAKEFPNVIVLGDKTGGGAGLPMDYTLYGGWQLRLSSTRSVDARGVDFELGVEPDVYHTLNIPLLTTGVDSMIEEAKNLIESHYN